MISLQPYRASDEDAAIALWQRTWQQAYPQIAFAKRVEWWRGRWRNDLVPVADILYLRAEQKYVTVRTLEREHLVEESLTRLEEEFGEAFVRVHRNCLVARAAIEGFERADHEGEAGWAVVVRGTGERLAVSRRQQHIVREFR